MKQLVHSSITREEVIRKTSINRSGYRFAACGQKSIYIYIKTRFSFFGGQAIVKSISYDNLPHKDYLSRLKLHVLQPFPLSSTFDRLQYDLSKYNTGVQPKH